MTIELPKFDFSKSSLPDDTALAALDAEQGNNKSKYISKPGRYDVKLASIEFTGVAKKDANWGNMMATYEDGDGRTIRDYFMIPFSDHLYGEKRTSYPFRKLVAIAAAYGQTLTVANTADVMKALFAKPERLVGKLVTIEVGYEGGYVHYAGKAQDGTKRYQLYASDKNPLRDPATSAPLEFPDYPAAEAYAAANGVAYDKYPRVLAVTKPVTATGKAPANW